ncbi:MAG: thiamine-phosphate kinase [Maricaulaceae bacterium]
MDEFDFIRDKLAPLAGPEGLKLKDDTAIFSPAQGYDLVLTKDAMVEGVHFPYGEYGGNVAEKLLRVNLSDLAAKGATPLGYLLSLAIPKPVTQAHLNGFTVGLRDVQDAYNFGLWGGDTVSTSGPFVVSATFIGQVPKGQMVKRSGAEIGDDIWVTGTIGDAYLGLQNVLGRTLEPQPTSDQIWHWEEAYLRPEPRLLLRKLFRQFATAALDVSDGLLADAEHLALASDVGLDIELDRVPFSNATQAWLFAQDNRQTAYESLLSGGDDYEVIFTANSKHTQEIKSTAEGLGVSISKVGKVTKPAESIKVVDESGEIIVFEKKGYKHSI